MEAGGALIPTIAFALAWLGSLLAMPVAVVLGSRMGLMVRSRHFGQRDRWVSSLGGPALAVVACAVFLLAGGISREAAALVVCALAILGLGVSDDRLRRGLAPSSRLVLEGVVAAGAWAGGLRPEITGTLWIDLPVTVFFLVAAANGFNLLDNMDGVAGATAAVSSAGICALAAFAGHPVLASLAAAVCGASLGFLRHNVQRPKVFLGNGGSLFLGFLLGGAALTLRFPFEGMWNLAAAVAVLAVPATDTAVVIVSRAIAGRRVFQGGTDHISHRLVSAGLTPPRAALAHAGAAAVGAASAAGAMLTGRPESIAVVLGLFMAAGIALIRVPIYRPRPGLVD